MDEEIKLQLSRILEHLQRQEKNILDLQTQVSQMVDHNRRTSPPMSTNGTARKQEFGVNALEPIDSSSEFDPSEDGYGTGSVAGSNVGGERPRKADRRSRNHYASSAVDSASEHGGHLAVMDECIQKAMTTDSFISLSTNSHVFDTSVLSVANLKKPNLKSSGWSLRPGIVDQDELYLKRKGTLKGSEHAESVKLFNSVSRKLAEGGVPHSFSYTLGRNRNPSSSINNYKQEVSGSDVGSATNSRELVSESGRLRKGGAGSRFTSSIFMEVSSIRSESQLSPLNPLNRLSSISLTPSADHTLARPNTNLKKEESTKSSLKELTKAEEKVPLRKNTEVKVTTRLSDLPKWRQCYILYFRSPMFNEYKEPFETTLDRQFWVELAAADKDLSFGLHPHSAVVVAWKFFFTIIQVLALLLVPVLFSFENLDSTLRVVVTWAISCSYVLDIIFNLNTLLISDSNASIETQSLALSRIKYLKTYFVCDLIAIVPIGEMMCWSKVDLAPVHYHYFNAVQLFGVRTLVRNIRSNPICGLAVKFLNERFSLGSSFIGILVFGGFLFVFLHYHTCMIFLLGHFTDYHDPFWLTNDKIIKSDVLTQYVWAMFKSVANTFPVTGFVPTDTFEQVATIITVFIGAFLYACLVATISSFSLGLDSSGKKFNEMMDQVNEYMEHTKLSVDSRKRVRQLFRLKYHGKYFNHDLIMSEMNRSLFRELKIQTLKGLISKVSFLKREIGDGRDEEFIARVAFALEPAYYLDGDFIFRQGEVGSDMFFIEKGTVEILVNDVCVGGLRDGAFFGEVALLDKVPRSAGIRATTNSKLHRLGLAELELILSDYQDVSERMKEVYEERVQRIRAERNQK
ncbi:Potassium voltage-gated channel sub H member 7 [Phlyctochytrium planicorne]|nr:Potassium voltage-gated channel sub H member 7 [Phlyctochytrium planicorne]